MERNGQSKCCSPLSFATDVFPFARIEDSARNASQVKIKQHDDDVGEIDELSSEHAISEDRPAKPEDPVETEFKETGLPDWLDPIYDYADSGEELVAELSAGRDGYT